MTSIQIRLSKGSPLGNVMLEILNGIAGVLSKHKGAVSFQPAQIVLLARLIRSRLREAVKAYRVCGDRDRCHEQSIPAGVGGPWRQPRAAPDQKILLFKDSLDALATRIAADVFDLFCPQTTTRQWLALKPELDQVIEEALGPLLYVNPFCVNCPRCTPDQQINPWESPSNP